MTILENVKSSFESGQYKECLIFVDKLLEVDKNNFNALCYRGTCLAKLGYYSEAINILTKCIIQNNNLFFLYVTRGDCYYETKDLNRALSDYWISLQMEQNGSVMDKCARTLFLLGNTEYAMEYIQKAIMFAGKESPEPTLIMIAMLNKIGLSEYALKVVKIGINMFPNEERLRILLK